MQKPDWRAEKKLNKETFGVAGNVGGYRGRGGYGYGRGRGYGGYGGGYGGRGGYRGNSGFYHGGKFRLLIFQF